MLFRQPVVVERPCRSLHSLRLLKPLLWLQSLSLLFTNVSFLFGCNTSARWSKQLPNQKRHSPLRRYTTPARANATITAVIHVSISTNSPLGQGGILGSPTSEMSSYILPVEISFLRTFFSLGLEDAESGWTLYRVWKLDDGDVL